MSRRRPRRSGAPPLALVVSLYLVLQASARDAAKLAQDKPAVRRQLATRQLQTGLPSLSATRVLNDERVGSVRLLRRRHLAVRTLGRSTLLSTVAGSVAACYPGWKQEGLDGVGLGPLCALAVSVTSNVLFYLFQRWSLWFKVAMNYRQAFIPQDSDAVLVLPKSHRGEAALVPLLHEQSNDGGRETSVTSFSFQHRGYTLTRVGFQPRKPSHTLPITRYLDTGPFEGAGGLGGVKKAIRDYGPNKLDVAIPSLARLMLDESVSPVSVIKALDLLLALADGSPPLLLAVSALQFVAFRLRCAMMVRRNLRKLRSEVVKARGGAPGSLRTFREGEWGEVSAEEMAPGDIVYLGPGLKEAPADVLVLSGQAVVDEAILTGESLPQLKIPLAAPAEGATDVPRLDMDGVHRPNVIFSGTRCLRVEASEEEGHGPELPSDVEVGVVARVLRTGYFSTQGELLRMIDFRSAKVDADSADTLRIFGATGLLSMAAAVGVIVRGSKDGKKSPIQLLLRACILLSRGIPFYLLDMLSDTVAYAVHELNTRHGILCTEPFRIPIAGSVDTCLLDKTGTLTTEHLVLRGVVPAGAKRLPLQPPGQAPIETQRILAACHALVEVDQDDHDQDDGRNSRVNLAGDSLELTALRGVGWSFDGKASVAQPMDGTIDDAVHVLRRHPFSSSLQRMSVVVQPLTERTGFFGTRHRQRQIALVKGSPEAMALLLDVRTKPLWYDAVYKQLAMTGTRVLALGWREGHDLQHADRSDVESNLTFAGFAAFDTSIRADTPEVMASLKGAGMALCVVSGDALLTCVHVAKSVEIISRGKRVAVLEQDADGDIAWWTGEGGKRKRLARATLRKTEALARKYELCATGPVLKAALDGEKKTKGLGRALHRFRVLARMTPELKERVVRVMRTEGRRTVMMCGDGANDVGALKQADVGVALLTGFGSANVEKLHGEEEEEGEEDGANVTQNEQIRDAFKNALIAELERKKKEEGEPATFGGQLKMFWTVYRKVSKRFFSDELGAASALADDDGTGDTLKLGDASLAAPFTAKSPSVRCVVDLIRHGRATQARAQQQAQQGIQYALSALIYRFALSELDARLSRRQLVVLNLFSTLTELGMRDVRPLDDISAARLPSSVFHPASIFSIVGQTLLQTGFTYTLLRMASKTFGVELPAADAHELAAEDIAKGDKPSTAAKHLGSLLFLSQLIDRASECIITVKGRPFSTGILDNQTLITTIMALIALPVFAALELDAKFNERLDLTRMGAQPERTRLAGALLLQLSAPIVWDAVMLRSFAPAVWTALRSMKMDEGFKKAVVGRMAQGAVLCVMLYKDLLPWDGVVTTLARDPQEDIRALEERAEALLKGVTGAVHSMHGGEGASEERRAEGGEAWGVKGHRRGSQL